MPRDVTQLDPTVPDSPGREWVDAVPPILEGGKNVISSNASGMHWRQLSFGLDETVAMTAARRVNAIEAMVRSTPGYKTVNDLPAFGARFGALLQRRRPADRVCRPTGLRG
jgi:hypothetical protein